MPSFAYFALAIITIALGQTNDVFGIETQCNDDVEQPPSNICPSFTFYSDPGCGVRDDPVALYCSITFLEGSFAAGNFLFKNCAYPISDDMVCDTIVVTYGYIDKYTHRRTSIYIYKLKRYTYTYT